MRRFKIETLTKVRFKARLYWAGREHLEKLLSKEPCSPLVEEEADRGRFVLTYEGAAEVDKRRLDAMIKEAERVQAEATARDEVEEAERQRASDAMDAAVAKFERKAGRVLKSIYSMDEMPDDVVVDEPFVLRSEGWEGTWESGRREKATALDLMVLADEAMRMTDDEHHCFLEGVRKTKRKKDGVPVYDLVMGS